jgi:hypothetical protein
LQIEKTNADFALWLFPISDSPDGIVTVLTNEQRAILCNGEPHRTTPNIAFRGYETCQEIVVNPPGFSILQRDPHDLVSRSLGPVPRTVESDKRVPLEVGRKLFTLVKNQV